MMEKLEKLIKEITSSKEEIAERRDVLRDKLSELMDLKESLDRGIAELESAIDSLSELL